MAKILINKGEECIEVNGHLSFVRKKIENINSDGSKSIDILIEGILQTHLYFDEIYQIQTHRYKLTGIDVIEENFGSDDYNINYRFTAKDLENIGIEAYGAVFDLVGDEMKRIEDEMYKDEHPFLGAIGKEYKDIVSEKRQKKEDGDKEDVKKEGDN